MGQNSFKFQKVQTGTYHHQQNTRYNFIRNLYIDTQVDNLSCVTMYNTKPTTDTSSHNGDSFFTKELEDLLQADVLSRQSPVSHDDFGVLFLMLYMMVPTIYFTQNQIHLYPYYSLVNL